MALPAPPQQKRLGSYRSLGKGKMRLDFDDKEALSGIMVVTRQKKNGDTWLGSFTEKADGKVIRNWQVEVRPIEDERDSVSQSNNPTKKQSPFSPGTPGEKGRG